jgi:hypothetical protein
MGKIQKENIFHVIDTKEKAYWLGFLFADGRMKKDKRAVQICLSVKDEIQIDDFISFVGGDIEDKRYYGPYKTSGKQVHYYLSNSNLYTDLINLGCLPNKHKNISFRKLDNNFLDLAFILGFYDGDGTQGSTDITCGSITFLEQVRKHFNIKNKIKVKINPYGKAYNLSLGIDLFQLMLENYDGGLRRKRFIRDRKHDCLIKRNETYKKSKLNMNEITELNKDISLTKIAEKMGVHRNTIYKFRRKNICE